MSHDLMTNYDACPTSSDALPLGITMGIFVLLYIGLVHNGTGLIRNLANPKHHYSKHFLGPF